MPGKPPGPLVLAITAALEHEGEATMAELAKSIDNPQEHRKARKAHKCTYCAEPINVGDIYVHQTGVYDCHWYTSKMHPECFEDMCDGDGEYTPYSNERPEVQELERTA